MRRVLAGGLSLAASLSLIGASLAQEAAAPMAAARFKPIVEADLEKMPSGCSFSAMRGKDLVAIMVDEGYQTSNVKTGKPNIWFKIDGKLAKASGEAKKNPNKQYLGVWTGVVEGATLRIVEGKKNPKFKNDGGGEGGSGKIEWKGAGEGSMPITWEAGC